MVWWIYALITMLMFGITNFLVKYAGYNHMDSIFASILLWLATGAMGIIFMLVYKDNFVSNIKNTSPYLLLLPVIAGITLAIGMYTIKLALSNGPAGPTVAITAANAFLVAIFSYIIIGEELSTMKIIGMLVILAGLIILTF